jgi:hypothetical protein
VQVVREFFVHVNDHGIFFGGIVRRGIKERALEPIVVTVFVFDEFFAAPGVVRLKRIGFGDLLRIFQIGSADERVGGLNERLRGVLERIGIFASREMIKALVEPKEMLLD